MKLFVIILCLFSERFIMHAISYKRFIWFGDYCKKISHRLHGNKLQSPWVLFIIFVLPPLILFSLIYFLFHTIVFGFFGLILNVLIFYYCLGPQNPFYPITAVPDEDQKNAIQTYFAQVNTQLFAVIFWYIFLGPLGLLFYRLCTLCRQIDSVALQANQVSDVLEWIPARMTVLLYLLVGNFQRGFQAFIRFILARPAQNEGMLGTCGLLAVQASDIQEVSIADAEHLVEHACFVLLVLIALFTLMAWV
ncbi:MAG: hypothetical protein H0U75_11045 [Legionella sp.]|nr:hypothetical protein [Legionella sp.]